MPVTLSTQLQRSPRVPLRAGRTLAVHGVDFRGTLGVDREAPVGFTSIRLAFDLQTDLDDEEVDALLRTTERYCVVLQTLARGTATAVVRTVYPT